MFKVLIWDYTGESSKWCKVFLDKDVKVIQTIRLSDDTSEVLKQKEAWDWLLIFERNMRADFDNVIKVLKLPFENVVYARDAVSWLQHPKAAMTLLNDKAGASVRRLVAFNYIKKYNAFATCTVENVSYIATSSDPFRMPHMFSSQLNWVSNNMKRFHALSRKYYNVDDSSGYFLDLGANIGTSGLYFIKNITPNLKLLSFEPDPENFKMHRLNIILNDLEEVATLVNCGLSNETSELTFYSNGSNPGARGFIKHETSEPIATAKIIPLDAYLAENNIAASEVRYIWLDTEGFESRVLVGAKNLLKENPVPIFMECNLRAWDESGLFEDMMNLLSEGYSHFIHFWKGEILYPLEALRTMERPNNPLGQMSDIFLIRKGAIV